MIRVRFHGRGGQGMKTASRILGSAAHHAGRVVQDSPVYGAERRGAPIMAFTRVATAAILERGIISNPDLVVVADDTLLSEPSAQPLAGCDPACTLLLNTTQPATALAANVQHGGPCVRADFTSLALHHTATLASLSTALGVAAATLLAFPLDAILAGVEDELHDAGLDVTQCLANRELAQAVYSLGRQWTPVVARQTQPAVPAIPLVDVAFDPPGRAAPSVYALANSPQRHTGSWRQFRPVLQPERCTRCWLCFVWCPEAAIQLDAQDYPVVDYDVCKGCLLCAHECPTQAFRIDKEAR